MRPGAGGFPLWPYLPSDARLSKNASFFQSGAPRGCFDLMCSLQGPWSVRFDRGPHRSVPAAMATGSGGFWCCFGFHLEICSRRHSQSPWQSLVDPIWITSWGSSSSLYFDSWALCWLERPRHRFKVSCSKQQNPILPTIMSMICVAQITISPKAIFGEAITNFLHLEGLCSFFVWFLLV